MTAADRGLPRTIDLELRAHDMHVDERGALCPIDLSEIVEFEVVRLFWVGQVPSGSERGGHAHKRCSQYLICLSGQIAVTVTDGEETAELSLDRGKALLIRPGLWASQRYLAEDASLLVLCDQPYDRDDYITLMADFLAYRRDLSV